MALAPHGLPVVGIPERTALIRGADGSWRSAGRARSTVFVDGAAGSRPGPGGAGLLRGSEAEPVQSISSMVTDSMVTLSVGLPEAVPTASIAATTSSPATTLPNREYCGGGGRRRDR